MKKKFYEYFVYISLILVNFFVKINSYKLCALIFWLNIRKLKISNSNTNSKKIKKILVFPKSNGIDDLIQSFKNKKTNIMFFLLPRSFVKKIYSNYFDKSYQKDYFTKLTKLRDVKKKNLYINFLYLTFNYINKYLRFDSFISFNIFYYAEKYLEEVCKNLNSKFIIIHKESAFNTSEEKNAEVLYKKYNSKSLAYKIFVYTESQKKILIRSKIADKKQILVIGTPRSDYAFKLREIAPKGQNVLFYLIEYNRTKTVISSNKKSDWKKLYTQTLKYIFQFAKKNPNIKIILKGKIGAHKRKDPEFKNMPKNCIFIGGGAGHMLLKNASVVIAFNSTILFETIASNRHLIVPNFNNENEIKKYTLLNVKNKNHLVNTKQDFDKKIKFYLNLKYNNKKMPKADIKNLKYYLGNTHANSGQKLKEFLERL
ncbi:hypothetical protein OAP45_01005 [Candidatus Pelagibacter sp.]|nr:hypothetical protein [Candidatus Pelagibacter sp.]